MPNESLFIFAEGLSRIRLRPYTQTAPFLKAAIEPLPEAAPVPSPEMEALRSNVVITFQQIVAASPGLSDELQTMVSTIEEPGRIADFVASSLGFFTREQRQELLEALDVGRRLDLLHRLLIKERQLMELRSKIESEVQDQLAQGQREFYLREQMKAIQKELGGRRGGA